MVERPNILFLMVDQMQAQVLRPGHPCRTPNLDRLAARGVRLDRAYTANAICSPARASLMTGLLPHNHGVLWVTHCVDTDQGQLRTDRPHWAQRLVANGYRTGYFGKWHVEHDESPANFGWQTDGSMHSDRYRERLASTHRDEESFKLARYNEEPAGYRKQLHYGVTNRPPEQRNMGIVTGLADEWLATTADTADPWCCFVSLTEPHDPFVAGADAFAEYDVDALPLPASARDDLAGRPGLYAKSARQWRGLTDRELREAMACYYASITEIDKLFGRLIDRLDEQGQLEQTIIVVTSDHGELLGAHGMYCKNVMASEEVYNIPLVLAGPGIASGVMSSARVGLLDLAPTIVELTGCEPMPDLDSRSFVDVLTDPARHEGRFDDGYAEYNGGRVLLTQRVLWQGDWKFVFNGFDRDELYDLATDPYELDNLAERPEFAEKAAELMSEIWRRAEESGDHSLVNSHYPPLRVAVVGPNYRP